MRALLVLIALGQLACGSSTAAEPTASDAGVVRVPAVHRASASTCPTTRDPGSATGSSEKCAADGDCTAGKNGRCNGSVLVANACSYDECATDGDCRAAVCDCRNGGTIGFPNKCIPGNCRTDGDCGGNYCSPSGTLLASGCTGFSAGSYGYFCHTSADECVDDKDCGDPIARCMFEPEVLHWKCMKVLCPR